ncbi:hypothetical protein Pcinc_029440 [Petrolisthes cinctipes]|uniref:ADP-ribosylation factor-like protein 13B n=1 Tax=Petrolisthes cinctipes TaxID=88211 RepID=A0AAE1F0U9_PETCI|nr:hypothetical protein Pcinc_029440 [Petrolisthes cinctipes]
MGNCLLLLGLKKEKRPVTLLLVGLDNAGKTTAAKGIVGEPMEDVAPTVGFAPESLEYRGCEVTIYDLGGGSKIRPVWTKYFSEIHGVIFVVDSSDASRLEECKEVLVKLLSDKKIAGKPILVLANKQDVEGAMDEVDVVEGLGIEAVVNKYKCPTRVETCTATTTRSTNKPDKPIADGFRWLIDTIVVHYAVINKRVVKDMERERNQQKKEMEERKERLLRLRLERERAEKRRREQDEGKRQQEELQRKQDEEAVKELEESSDEEEEEIVMGVPTHPSSSSMPNGLLPQSRNVSASGIVRRSPEEDQELRELGFKSQAELQESTSSSSSHQVSPDTSPTSPVPRPHRVILVQESPSHQPAAPKSQSLPPSSHPVHKSPPSPHHISNSTSVPHPTIQSRPSPSHTSRASPQLARSPFKDEDSGILDPNGYVTSNGLSTPRLDLCRESRTSECVPIDSDDELFDLTSVTSRRRSTTSSPPSSSSGYMKVHFCKGFYVSSNMARKIERVRGQVPAVDQAWRRTKYDPREN